MSGTPAGRNGTGGGGLMDYFASQVILFMMMTINQLERAYIFIMTFNLSEGLIIIIIIRAGASTRQRRTTDPPPPPWRVTSCSDTQRPD